MIPENKIERLFSFVGDWFELSCYYYFPMEYNIINKYL